MNDLTKPQPQNFAKRYAKKAVNVITRPLSRTVQLYNDPTYTAPTQKPKRNFVDRLVDRTILGAQSLKGGH